MTEFTRQSVLICSGRFTPADGSTTQPSTVTCVLTYTNLSGTQSRDTITLTLQADGITWQGSWDNTNSKPDSLVEWAVTGTGAVKGSDQGFFYTKGNSANI
jgi:hypothetical protein